MHRFGPRESLPFSLHARRPPIPWGVSPLIQCWQIARTAEHDGAQVDLLIDRKDGVINLCEMKFASTEYEIKDSEDRHARERKELFRETTGTRKAVHLTYVTTYGLKRNMHSGIVQSEVTLDDLFKE